MSEEQCREMEKLIESETSSLWSYAMSITGKAEDAEDLLQETFMKICTNFESFEDGSNFKAWARRIMFNSHINKMRRRTTSTVAIDDAAINRFDRMFLNDGRRVSKLDNPEKVFAQNHIDAQLMELFYSLSDDYRIVFSLFHFDGYTYVEIAKALDISIGTVKSRIYRARQHMTEKVRSANSEWATTQ